MTPGSSEGRSRLWPRFGGAFSFSRNSGPERRLAITQDIRRRIVYRRRPCGWMSQIELSARSGGRRAACPRHPPEELPDPKRQTYLRFIQECGPFRNQLGALSHVPAALGHLPSMLMELRQAERVPHRLIELAVVAVSRLNKCGYCVAHHGPMLMVEGLSPAGLDRILDYQDHDEMDEADRLVVEYAIAITRTPQRIRDSLFDRLHRHFDDAQIVELTLRISLAGFFNRFNDVLQIEHEPEVLASALAGS